MSAETPTAQAVPPGEVAAELPLFVNECRRGWKLVDLRELWHYRELGYFLCWRDIKVRYKQTVLGVLWAVLQPFLSMIVFTVFFGRLAGLDQHTGGVPYPVFVFAGLLPWTLFAQSLSRSSESVVASTNIVSKVYFPRMLIPIAATGACFLDFAISFVILIGLLLWYAVAPSAAVLLLPVFILLAVMTALGFGLLLSALTVAYRDFRHVIPFGIQIWLFLTPVIYPVAIVPERWRWLLALNPMSGVISGCRSAILNAPFDWTGIGVSAAVTVAVFLSGLAYFRKVERRFADII